MKQMILTEHAKAAAQAKIETASLMQDTDTLYLADVVDALLILHREEMHSYVIDHSDGMKPGDFLFSHVPPSWTADMIRSLDLPEWEGLERLADLLLTGMSSAQSDMVCSMIAVEFEWSATQTREDFLVVEWEIASEYRQYHAATSWW